MTTETQAHTPGPWEVGDRNEYGDRYINRVGEGAGHWFVLVAQGLRGVQEYPSVANANLIAAAPDMLTALEFTRSFIAGIEGLHIGSSWWKLIDDAIAKARGAS